MCARRPANERHRAAAPGIAGYQQGLGLGALADRCQFRCEAGRSDWPDGRQWRGKIDADQNAVRSLSPELRQDRLGRPRDGDLRSAQGDGAWHLGGVPGSGGGADDEHLPELFPGPRRGGGDQDRRRHGDAKGQGAEIAFHSASNQYIHEKDQEAKNTLDAAIKKYPNDQRLKTLRAKIKEDEKKEEEEKKKQDKKDQDKKDQQNKDQQNKEQKDQKDKEQKSKEQQEKEKKEKEQLEKEQQEKNEQNKEKLPPSVSDKLKQMQMSEEKAKMILEAMKNQEVQYLQQNKRKASKPRDKGKPDW